MARGAIQWQEGPRVRIRFAPAVGRANFVLRRWLVPMSSNASSNYENLIRTVARRDSAYSSRSQAPPPFTLPHLMTRTTGQRSRYEPARPWQHVTATGPVFSPGDMVAPKFAHRSMFAFATDGSLRMAVGVPKISKIRRGAWSAGNSPTNAVTSTDILLTVCAYYHAGLGSPPSTKPRVCRAASECPPRRCSSLQLPSRSHNGFARRPDDRSETGPARPRGGIETSACE